MRDLVESAPVIVCLGSGGVGKTTVAAAIGVAAARRGRRVVVLTVDPARRLADALGLDDPAARSSRRLGESGSLGNEPRSIAGDWPGELWAVMLDPRATLDDLIREHAPTEERATRILENRIYRNLTTSLSGTNEYMASERLRSLHIDPRFDLVVVDTPPSRHAIDLLDSPGRLTRFVNHRLYRAVLAPRRGLLRVVNSAAQLTVRTISRVVGATLLADVVDFFAAFEDMDQGFRDRASDVERLLHDPSTAYVVVASARHQPMDEARWLVERLAERDHRIDAVVVNRLTPNFVGDAGLSVEDLDRTDPLDRNLIDLLGMRQAEERLVDRLTSATSGAVRVSITEQDRPVSDLDGVAEVSRTLTRP